MIQLRNSRFYKNLFEALATGVVIQEEGVALVFVKENGETKVQVSTGAAGERFAGLAMARNLPPNAVPLVEEFTVPASKQVELSRTPIAAQAFFKGLTLVEAAPAAGEVQIVGNKAIFNAAQIGAGGSAQYLYAPTVAEARTILGDAPYGGLAANALGTIACIKEAEVATSFFDASADWTNTTYAKLLAGGKFGPGTIDDHTAGVVVKNSPNVGNPFLVLEINVAA